jgi:hypothetical protein
MVVFLFLSLRNTDGTVFQGANSGEQLVDACRSECVGSIVKRRAFFSSSLTEKQGFELDFRGQQLRSNCGIHCGVVGNQGSDLFN